jgi:NTP pyrophosphatase (non-canonical NTP hydrolase)
MLDKLRATAAGLNRCFPDGNDPFRMLARLLEECGELAQQVNLFEGTGVKREKYGEPDRGRMAKEIMDVLRCVFQIIAYYDIEREVAGRIEWAYERLREEGYIEGDERR